MASSIESLLEIMRRLRAPDGGCPWDREQTLQSLVKHTLEEAYEVADVIERGALAELPGELGDLLFQIVFYCQIAAEGGHFDFPDVAARLEAKLIARHPHVFGDDQVPDAATQAARWEGIKAGERAAGAAAGGNSALAGVPRALPALPRAHKLQARAARVGFDWAGPDPIFDKVMEELEEVAEARAAALPATAIEDEVGDLLFACVNLARHLSVDPEAALRRATRKFERRFEFIEAQLAERGTRPEHVDLPELDRLWEAAKAAGH